MTLRTTALIAVHLALLCGTLFSQIGPDAGIELFNKGDYDGAVKTLKNTLKADPSDEMNWYYLGLAHLKQEDFKDAIKALVKARDLSPKDAPIRVALGYAYLLGNNLTKASSEAYEAVKLDPRNGEAHYVVGAAAYRSHYYDSAYDYANSAIAVAPDLPLGYLLKSQALTANFARPESTVKAPTGRRFLLLKEAAENLEKFLRLAPAAKDNDFHRAYLESLKYFSDYFNRTLPELKYAEAASAGDTTKLRILKKPRAQYTGSAKRAGVDGEVELLIGFSADGAISHILIIKALSHGLSESAVKAARQIQFEPESLGGKPVSVARRVVYHFSIY